MRESNIDVLTVFHSTWSLANHPIDIDTPG
jgi:hypothetical protein